MHLVRSLKSKLELTRDGECQRKFIRAQRKLLQQKSSISDNEIDLDSELRAALVLQRMVTWGSEGELSYPP